ncbi:MAG TPA: carboxypeptidase regulatory-like domain-containing protein [Terriglobales bacterium]|nr:carboxypeptidase regulatory-like domain-containing protein [Terriglobales bacterium]
MTSIGKTLQIFLVFLALALAASAQTETGQISGIVTDASGAVVPNVTVTVRNISTGATRTTTANDSGSYTVSALQPGTYEVKAEGQNFSPVTRRVQVTVGSRNTLDLALNVAGSSTTVEVTADTTNLAVNTQTQTLGQTVTGRQVSQLPSLTRNAYDFVGTAGNVAEEPEGGTARGAGFSINGQRSASTNILLDGGENVDLFSASVGQTTPIDSVQEFSVLTSNFSAEYGRASGGVVNVATKSGTNQFHGSLFEFNRLSKLSSNTAENNANAIPKSRFVRNQFGYSVGGPVVPNRLFFFSSTEWTRIRSNGAELAWVPTSQFVTAPGVSPLTRAFFTGQTIRDNAVVQDTLTASQLATILGSTGAFATFAAANPALPVLSQVSYRVPNDAGGGIPQNSYSMAHRIDLNITDRTSLYGRYAYQNQDLFVGSNADSAWAGFDTGSANRNHNGLITLTHIFGPKVVSSSKVNFNRLDNFQPLGAAPVQPTLYFRATVVSRLQGVELHLPGYLPDSPGNAIPFGGPQNLYQFYQDFTFNFGKHDLKVGGQYIHTRDNRIFGAYQNSVENLSQSSIPLGFDNFITGNLNDFQGAVDPQGKFPGETLTLPVSQPRFNRNNRYNDYAAYVQDNWKVMNRLTLNLGVRWEYYGVQHNADPNLDSNFVYGSGADQFERIRSGKVFTVPTSPIGALWNPDYNNFAPRVGFAWDMFGTGKTSLRGGYGISYERNFGNVTFNVIQNPPNYAVISVRPADVGGTLTVTPNNAGPLTGTGTKILPPTSLRWVDENIGTAYAQTYSLAFEQQVFKDSLLALEYSGSRGIHLYTIENPNRELSGLVYLGLPVTTTNPTQRINEQYSNLNRRGKGGDSYYNGLNVSFRSNNLFQAGLSMNANYTYSHAIDNLSTTFSEFGNNFNLGLLDPFQPQVDRGNADFDIRHRFSLAAVWDLPIYRNSGNWAQQNIIGGWTIAPIFSARTGNPYSIFDCTNAFFQVCPRWIPGSAPAFSGEAGAEAGPNTFAFFDPYQYGVVDYVEPVTGTGEYPTCTGLRGQGCTWPANMTQRNAFRGPNFWNLDLGVYKNFKVTERVGLQFRGEMYNLFNHSNHYVIGSGADVSSGDPIFAAKGTRGNSNASDDERRNVQFGLRITF